MNPRTAETNARLECLDTIDSSFKVMALSGDILVIADETYEVHIVNWRTKDMAVLRGSDEPSEYNFQVINAQASRSVPKWPFSISFAAQQMPASCVHAALRTGSARTFVRSVRDTYTSTSSHDQSTTSPNCSTSIRLDRRCRSISRVSFFDQWTDGTPRSVYCTSCRE